MDYFLLFGLIGFGGMIIGFVGYKFTTERVIKDQEKEISKLTKEIERYKAAVKTLNPYVLTLKADVMDDGSRERPKDLFKEF